MVLPWRGLAFNRHTLKILTSTIGNDLNAIFEIGNLLDHYSSPPNVNRINRLKYLDWPRKYSSNGCFDWNPIWSDLQIIKWSNNGLNLWHNILLWSGTTLNVQLYENKQYIKEKQNCCAVCVIKHYIPPFMVLLQCWLLPQVQIKDVNPIPLDRQYLFSK